MIRLACALLGLTMLAACGLRGGLERPPPAWGDARARYEEEARQAQERAREEEERARQQNEEQRRRVSGTLPGATQLPQNQPPPSTPSPTSPQ